jgi:hypothetical protein
MAATTNQETETRACNVGSSFIMVIECAVPNIIRICPRDRGNLCFTPGLPSYKADT